MLDRIELVTGSGTPQWTILWLHGLGADGHDFEPIVPELVRPEWPVVRFVFPHAPVRPVTINGGMRMRAWYDILGQEIANRQDERGIRDSAAMIDRLIEQEHGRGIPEERIVLAGFSQGGAIALAAGLRHPHRLGAIIALSTYLPLADRTEGEAAAANRGVPIWMGHGKQDPVVPHSLGVMSRDWLARLGYPVQWHSYEMPHSVCAEEIRDLSLWLGQRFAAGGDG
jgi:phospholipase/carboxylesterase